MDDYARRTFRRFVSHIDEDVEVFLLNELIRKRISRVMNNKKQSLSATIR